MILTAGKMSSATGLPAAVLSAGPDASKQLLLRPRPKPLLPPLRPSRLASQNFKLRRKKPPVLRQYLTPPAPAPMEKPLDTFGEILTVSRQPMNAPIQPLLPLPNQPNWLPRPQPATLPSHRQKSALKKTFALPKKVSGKTTDAKVVNPAMLSVPAIL